MGFTMLLGLAVVGQPSFGLCEEARARYEALSLREADALAKAVLAQNPDRPLACLEVRALALLGLGRLEDARGVLTELFARSPNYILEDPSLSPAVQERIEAIKASVQPLSGRVTARWIGHETLRIDTVLTGGLRGATRIRYIAEVADGDAYLKASRHEGEVALIGPAATATLAVAREGALDRLRFSADVVTASDQVVYSLKTELLLPPRPPPADRVVIERTEGPPWWLWVAVGAVVVGAAASIAVIAQPGLPDGEGLGRLKVDP